MTPIEKEWYRQAPEEELALLAPQPRHRWENTARNIGITTPEFFKTGIIQTNKRLFHPTTLAKIVKSLNLGAQLQTEKIELDSIFIYENPDTKRTYIITHPQASNEVKAQKAEMGRLSETPLEPAEQTKITTHLPTRDQVLIYAGNTPHTGYETVTLAQKVYHDAEQKDTELSEKHPHGLVALVGEPCEEVAKTISEAEHWTSRHDTRAAQTPAEIIHQITTIEEVTQKYHGILTLPFRTEMDNKTKDALRSKLLPGGKLVMPLDEQGNYIVLTI